MAELAKGSIELSEDAARRDAESLLGHYSFELGRYPIDQLLDHWLKRYCINWVRLAIIEALYQGRYKAVSVEQILSFWQRRNQPLPHFNHEFERLVCNKLPRDLTTTSSASESASSSMTGLPQPQFPFQIPRLKPTYTPRNPVELLSLKVALAEEEASGTGHPSIQNGAGQKRQRFHPSPLPGSGGADVENSAPLQPAPPIERDAVTGAARSSPLVPELAATAPELFPLSAIGSQLLENGAIGGDEPEPSPLLPDATDCLSLMLLEPALSGKFRLELATVLPDAGWREIDRTDPIHQFVPATEGSKFYSKLKAVAHPDRRTE